MHIFTEDYHMGTFCKLEGEVLGLFKFGLRALRNQSLLDEKWVNTVGSRINNLNPLQNVPGVYSLLGGNYARFIDDLDIWGKVNLFDQEQSDGDSRVEAIIWLGEWLMDQSNLVALAEAGPVSIVLVEPSENDGEPFMFHNWVSRNCYPSFDYSLGPNHGVRFTS
jgi:hypothetical protein